MDPADELFVSDPVKYTSLFKHGSLLYKKAQALPFFHFFSKGIVIPASAGLQYISPLQPGQRDPTDLSSLLCSHTHRRHTCMVRSFQGKHVPPVVLFIIPRVGPSPVIEIHQNLPVSVLHPEIFLSVLQIQIRIFSVHRCHSSDILRIFHPPLDLEGIDPRLDHLRDQFERADVLQAEKIFFLPVHCIGKPAGLGALPPVPASSADHTAQQALSRITVTESSMYKALDLQPCLLPDLSDLGK